MRKKTAQINKFKRVVSGTIAIPAALLTTSEPELEFWWVPFLAMGVFLAVMKWNNYFLEV